MPSLEDIRRWLEGVDQPNLPPRKLAWNRPRPSPRHTKKHTTPLAKAMRAKKQAGQVGKYRISEDGEDAVLLFGKHNGKKVSELFKDDRSYLGWLFKQEFPDELIDVIKHQAQLLSNAFANDHGDGFQAMGNLFGEE